MKREEFKARPGRERLRTVRFLAAGPAAPRKAARDGKILLEGGERGTISVTMETLSELGRDRLLETDNGTLTLSKEGRALARRSSAGKEPFREQHIERARRTMRTETGTETVEEDLSESPLAQLARRRAKDGKPFLDEVEFRAGERLRSDYTRGQIMPRFGVNWSAVTTKARRGGNENGIADLTDAALAARQRVDRALGAVGPELAGVLVDVCCFLKGLERVESERGWPVRSAKVVLKTALAALGRHYEPPSQPRKHNILHWGAENYRPRMDS